MYIRRLYMLNRSILALMIYQGKFKPVRSGNASTQRMGIFMKHFKLKVLESEEDISIHKNKLSNICDREQSTFLKNKRNQFKTKLYESLEKKKHKKSTQVISILSRTSKKAKPVDIRLKLNKPRPIQYVE